MKIISIIGNRPQFIKAAIVQRAWQRSPKNVSPICLVHTGQHYDANLSDIFFEELGINEPDYNLGIGSGDITDQIAHILLKLNPVLEKEKPDAIMVYGDTNSTIAGSLAGAHKNIPVIHIEAGERLYIRQNQPEEINRVVTDSLSALCLTASSKAQNQLIAEGISKIRIRFVGDTMYDLFLWAQEHLKDNPRPVIEQNNLEDNAYILSTIHRAENTNNHNRLLKILNSMDEMDIPVILPIHPRTAKIVKEIGWKPKKDGALKIIDPCGYLDIIALLQKAKFVITDSGGLSRESFFAKKISIVPMSAPPWPEIKEEGWMYMFNPETEALSEIARNMPLPKNHSYHLFGEGDAGDKIVTEIHRFLENGGHCAWKPLQEEAAE